MIKKQWPIIAALLIVSALGGCAAPVVPREEVADDRVKLDSTTYPMSARWMIAFNPSKLVCRI